MADSLSEIAQRYTPEKDLHHNTIRQGEPGQKYQDRFTPGSDESKNGKILEEAGSSSLQL